ncbi:MAG TPA: histidine kinase [Candidatus Dormibacteraeota bacterium]
MRRFWLRYGDYVLAGIMSVTALAETATEGQSDRRFFLCLLATVPLAWRRRRPLAVLAAVAAGAAISRQAPYAEIVCAAIAGYSVGAYGRWWWAGLAELFVIAVFIIAVFGGGLPRVPDWAGPFIVLMPLWLGGIAIRQERARAAAQGERVARLEREQELTRQAAEAAERARIARDLHDVVAHSVSVMVVQAGAARHVVEHEPDRSLEALRAVEDTGREAMRELRRILGVLGDTEPELGPQPALGDVPALVESVRKAGLPVELAISGEQRPVGGGVELAAYRVIQEALTNALKHSGLAPTRVGIDYRPDELKVEVLCDGSVPAARNGTGRGIAGMRERVASVGGRLEAGPGVQRGYNVRAWLPL